MLQPAQVHTLDKLLWEETELLLEPHHLVELTLEPHDSVSHSRQAAAFSVPAREFNFETCNTPRTIFTNFPTFFKRCAALQLPRRTNCNMSVVAGPAKWTFSVQGSFDDFLSFGVTVIF